MGGQNQKEVIIERKIDGEVYLFNEHELETFEWLLRRGKRRLNTHQRTRQVSG